MAPEIAYTLCGLRIPTPPQPQTNRMVQTPNNQDARDETKMIVSYDGPIVRDGRMSAIDVGNAIIGMANVVSSSSKVLYGDGSRVKSVVETNFVKGSFDINFVVEAAGLFGDGPSINELMVLLFGAGHRGLFGLMKLIAGRKTNVKEATAQVDNRIAIQIEGDNNAIFIDKKLHDMYSDQDVREAAEATVRPLERDGLDVMKISDIRGDPSVLPLPDVTISEDEVGHFKAPSATGNVVHRGKSEALLRIVSPNFQQGNKWKVAQGQTTFFVTIEDKAFQEKVRRHEITFGDGDLLLVDMVTETSQISGEFKDSRIVERVKDHLSPQRYRQMGLDEQAEP